MRKKDDDVVLGRTVADFPLMDRRGFARLWGAWFVLLVGTWALVLSLVHGADFAKKRQPLSLSPESSSVREISKLRLLSWNVKAGALFPSTSRGPAGEELGARVGRFGRVIRAIQPDILCLQEIWPLRSQREVLEMLNRELPLAGGEDWSLCRAVDVVIASRFPLGQTTGDRVIHHPLPEMPNFHYGQAMAVVDLPDDRFSKDVFVLTAHFRSRSGIENIRKRERHAAAIHERIMERKRLGTLMSLPRQTPIIITGDFNVYDSNRDDPKEHLEILRRGLRPGGGGQAAKGTLPDWDQTPLNDLQPSINGRRKEFYTWRNDTGSYPPGALDRILFSDSVLRATEAFVLDPMTLSPTTRETFGLKPSDGFLGGQRGVYDHLPMIVDFVIEASAEN